MPPTDGYKVLSISPVAHLLVAYEHDGVEEVAVVLAHKGGISFQREAKCEDGTLKQVLVPAPAALVQKIVNYKAEAPSAG